MLNKVSLFFVAIVCCASFVTSAAFNASAADAVTTPSTTQASSAASQTEAKPEAEVKPEPKPAAPKKDEYKLGWRASMYGIPRGTELTAELPNNSVGSFLYKKSTFKITDYKKPLGFSINGKSILWRGQAFLIVEEAGNYVFIMDLANEAYGTLFIEGNKIAFGFADHREPNTIVGNANLEPGIYKIEFHAGGGISYGKARGGLRGKNIPTFSLRIKKPSDDSPQAIEKFLYVKK